MPVVLRGTPRKSVSMVAVNFQHSSSMQREQENHSAITTTAATMKPQALIPINSFNPYRNPMT